MNIQKRLFILIIVAICGIFILPFVMQLIVEGEFFGYEVNARIEELLRLINGEDLEGTDLSVRFLQYFTSLGAFFSSFGLGRIFVPSVSVGTHSQWFDGFGNYGVFFIVYLVGVFVFSKFIVDSMPDEGSKQLYKLVFIIYVVMSLTNTSTWAPITLSLFVMVPFMCMELVADKNPETALLSE